MRGQKIVAKVKTLQVGNKLFILNGVDPLRYVDLSNNKVHQYKKRKYSVFYRLLPGGRHNG